MSGRCRYFGLIAILCGLGAVAQPTASVAGEFDEIREEVRQKKPKKKKDKSQHCDDDDDDGGFLSILLSGLFRRSKRDDCDYDFRQVYDGSYEHLGSSYGEGIERLPDADYWVIEPPGMPNDPVVTDYFFAPYPYDGGSDGYMAPAYLMPSPRSRAGRVQFEYGSDFDAIDRWAASFLWEGSLGFGLDGQWNYYTEQLAAGGQDNLHVGDVNLLFRVIETEQMLWRFGLGMNWFDSRSISDAGFNSTVKVDLFPLQPLVMSGEVDYGWVGDAEMFHGGITVGLILNRFEVFSGYDYRKIGPVKLEGPLVGLRVWW